MDDLKIANALEVNKLSAMDQAKIVNSKEEKAKYQRMSQAEQGSKEVRPDDTVDIQIDKLVEIANQYVDRFTTKVSFSYDSELKIPMIYVREKDTGRVIRQIPPEQMVNLMKKMEEIAGIIYNGRA